MLIVPFFLSFSRPFFRLARLAKLAGHNARDGLTSHGFMGFGNDSSATTAPEKNDIAEDNSGGAKTSASAAASAAGRKWGNIIHVSTHLLIGYISTFSQELFGPLH